MKQTINKSSFVDAFRSAGRGEQFSGWALEALFDYLEEIDEDCELDVVSLCCEYQESTFEEIREDYSLDEGLSDDEILDWLNNETSVVTNGGDTVVFAQF